MKNTILSSLPATLSGLRILTGMVRHATHLPVGDSSGLIRLLAKLPERKLQAPVLRC